MPCCRCNGSGARCRGCSCAKGKKSCIDCYPGRKGKCVNSQTSSQPPLLIISPSCSSDHASQSLLPPLLCTTTPSPPEHCLYLPIHRSHLAPRRMQSLQLPTHIPPLSPPPPSNRVRLRYRPPSSNRRPGHSSNDLPTLADSQPQTQLLLPQSQLPQEQLPGSQSHHLQLSPETLIQSQSGSQVSQSRKPCLVEGCLDLIAPSMWKPHMTLHAQNILPGDVPLEWLQEQDSFLCLHCHQIVARFASHSKK